MNRKFIQDRVSKKERDLTALEKKVADIEGKISKNQGKIGQLERSVSKNSSPSSINSKSKKIESLKKDIERQNKKKLELRKKTTRIITELSTLKERLVKASEEERKREQRSQEALQQNLKQTIKGQSRQISELLENMKDAQPDDRKTEIKSYHFFISHASEDKEEIARPLANKLIEENFNVWFDEGELTIGDSLRRKIDEGLRKSRYGIVILSENFFKKDWPQKELDGLVQKEIGADKVVLPIWHKISRDKVVEYSPTLADKVAFKTSDLCVEEIVEKLKPLFNY